MDLERARRLYVEHEGSHFYLWKADRLDEYCALGIPEALERVWAEEMAEDRLRRLGEPDSWRTVSFLRGHEYLGVLPTLVATRPSGRLWERCSYEEELLRYLDRVACPDLARRPEPRHASRAELVSALESIIETAATIRSTARSDRSRSRIDQIRRGAEVRLAASRAAPDGRWSWTTVRAAREAPVGPGEPS